MCLPTYLSSYILILVLILMLKLELPQVMLPPVELSSKCAGVFKPFSMPPEVGVPAQPL